MPLFCLVFTSMTVQLSMQTELWAAMLHPMTMKEKFVKWMPVIALAFFVAAVFMIADGHFWNGIVFIGAGTSLSSAAAVYSKKNDVSDRDQETK